MDYIIGVDEAGRGSWAGPVSAGAFMIPIDFDFAHLPGLTDSKKLSQNQREKLFDSIDILAKEGKCRYSYAESPSSDIDTFGIREANRKAMQKAIVSLLEFIEPEDTYDIRIDGRDNYRFSEIPDERIAYIIRGDLTEPVISAASIVAKVNRDRRLCDFSVEFPSYAFDQHKGYGTRKHLEELMIYGISPLHRKSYAPVKRLISQKG